MNASSNQLQLEGRHSRGKAPPASGFTPNKDPVGTVRPEAGTHMHTLLARYGTRALLNVYCVFQKKRKCDIGEGSVRVQASVTTLKQKKRSADHNSGVFNLT